MYWSAPCGSTSCVTPASIAVSVEPAPGDDVGSHGESAADPGEATPSVEEPSS